MPNLNPPLRPFRGILKINDVRIGTVLVEFENSQHISPELCRFITQEMSGLGRHKPK